MKTKRIGILMGGMSAEREVSITTGNAIALALGKRGHSVVKVFVDRDVDQVLRQEPIDVAFLALHGSYGEDGCIQGLLEILRIPYTGSGVTESALCMDKQRSKELFRLCGVPTAQSYAVAASQLGQLEDIHGFFGYPVFVKPRRQGSSIGVGRADGIDELRARCEDAARFDSWVLVERYVAGREIAVGVLDGRALGAVEIVPKSGCYDYRSKYRAGQTHYHLPPRLPPEQTRELLELAERAVAATGACGASRVDLLRSEGDNAYVLEVNTLPGMTPTSLLPKIAAAAGYDFGDLCEAILDRASLHIGQVDPHTAPHGTAESIDRPCNLAALADRV